MKNKEMLVEKLKEMQKAYVAPEKEEFDFGGIEWLELGKEFLRYLEGEGDSIKAQKFFDNLKDSGAGSPMDFEASFSDFECSAPEAITNDMLYNMEDVVGFEPFVLVFASISMHNQEENIFSGKEQNENNNAIIESALREGEISGNEILYSIIDDLIANKGYSPDETYLFEKPNHPKTPLIKAGNDVFSIEFQYPPEFDGNDVEVNVDLVSSDVKIINPMNMSDRVDTLNISVNSTLKTYEDVYKEWVNSFNSDNTQSVASQFNNEVISGMGRRREFGKTFLNTKTQEEGKEIYSKMNKFEVEMSFSHLLQEILADQKKQNQNKSGPSA